MIKYLPFLSLFVLLGCASVEKNSSTAVYFGGEIVNPTSDFVVLFKDDVVIDSAKLDSQNRFSFHLDNIEEGLHHFQHKPELQYVFFEKGDSITTRLNTTDFDESLAFSGKGGGINNFLIDMFLTHEQEEAYIHSLFKLEPELFTEKIDSLKNLKSEILTELLSNNELSLVALEMAQASIDYNYYIYKEKYPFFHKRKTGEDNFHLLQDNFYKYRKDLNFNNKNLTYYRPYYRFMKYHYGNVSFANCSKECVIEDGEVKNNLHFYQHKLKLIDSSVKLKNLRDNLFRNIALDFLLKHENKKNNDEFIAEFHKYSSNNSHIKEIDDLYKNIKNIEPNSEVPEIILHDTSGKQVLLKDLTADKTTVFYFWSNTTHKRHFNNIIKRVEYLKATHPEYRYIGLNVKTDSERWLSMIKSRDLDGSMQYRITDYNEAAHSLIVFNQNKAFIAKDGLVVNAFANLYSSF